MKASADKAELRRQFRRLRRASLADSQALLLAVAQRELPALVPEGLRLGIYWPLAGEVDLRPLAALGLPLALPVVWAEPPIEPPIGSPDGLPTAAVFAALQGKAWPSASAGSASAGVSGSEAATSGAANPGTVEPGIAIAGRADPWPPAAERDRMAPDQLERASAPRLLYRAWQPGEPLAPDHCGIPAPLASRRRADPSPAALAPSTAPAPVTQIPAEPMLRPSGYPQSPERPWAEPPASQQPGTEQQPEADQPAADQPAAALPATDLTVTDLPARALALLLVPALAIDPRSGIRLGSGGGWYDRLRADPAWRAVPALAVLPAAGVVEGLPRDGWDVPFAGWLDETGLHWIAAGPDIAASNIAAANIAASNSAASNISAL